jgi:iron complex transport system permease protein
MSYYPLKTIYDGNTMLRYKKFSILALLCLAGAVVCNLVFSGDLRVISSHEWPLLLDIRASRCLTALFAGSAVSIAGTLSQSVFRNALATPSVLGTEAGASLGLALCFLFSASIPGSDLVMVSSVAGAIVATSLSLTLARGRMPLVRVLLGGFALNALLGASAALISTSLLETGKGGELYHWLLGSFSTKNWGHALLIATLSVCGLAASIPASIKLDQLSLGDDAASTLGISARSVHISTMVLISILVGGSISVGGALPFLGLVVPHFVRTATGPYMKPLLFNTFLCGGALALIADFAARTVRYPIETNVGLLTTIIGAPYFILLLKRQTSQ